MNSAWELSKLDAATFEHLVNALALTVLGAGATGFGPGADAGRDGYFEGKAPYPSLVQSWEGVWYIQSKYHAPHLTKDAQTWVLEQIKSELAAFKDPNKGRRWPDNWIFATNVEINAGKNGTFEKARRLVGNASPGLVKRFHIWGGQKIVEFLSQNLAVASRYGHFLTPGHVLSTLLEAMNDDRATVEQIVRALVLHGIRDHRRTRIEQAGSREDQPPGIEALFVDLPFVDAECKSRGDAVTTIAHAAAQYHRPDGTDAWGEPWRRWRRHPKRAAVWFVRAGPGRGKSTIGQFFCQVQRAALLAQDPTFKRRPEIDDIVKQVRVAAEALGVWPALPRIPIWVELKSYAAWFAEQPMKEPKGVLSWLATDLRRVLEVSVPVGTIQRALHQRSWVVVFDGLDEVPSSIKDSIANEVVRFVEETSLDSDLMTLCTSRPQGYSGQFDALGGAVVELIDLEPERALECASRVTRIGRTLVEAEAARKILEGSLRTPAVKEIMTTPLQAHIMAVLVRNGARPPERKWDLYDRFYKVIREREANRNLPDPRLKALLQGDSRIIDGVHQRLGFLLHAKAETAAGAEASLSRSEFRTLVQDVVRRFGASGNLDEMVEVVTSAATDRLVLINTPDSGSHVRFDVRAIQEFFAAEFLYEDVESQDLRARLEVVAGDSHWREVVQFLLGALVSTRRRTERTVAFDVLRWLDQGRDELSHRPLAQHLAVGAMHAMLLLANGVAEADQQVRMQLRDLLEPIAATTDWNLLRPMKGIVGIQTRTWLWGWVKEQIRTRSSRESEGAVQTLAALCLTGQPDETDLLAFVASTTTPILAMFVEYLGLEHRPDDKPLQRWERLVIEALLAREDLVKNAPSFIWSIVHATYNGTDRQQAVRYGGRRMGEIATLSGIQNIFAPALVEQYGTLVVSTCRLSQSGGKMLMRPLRHDRSAPPLLRWFARLMASASTPTVARAREILAEVGSNWYVLQVLPGELTRGVPVLPVSQTEPDLSPLGLAELLDGMTDEEFAQSLTKQHIVGRTLRMSGSWVFRAHANESTVDDVERLVAVHPELFLQTIRLVARSDLQPIEGLRKWVTKVFLQHPDYMIGADGATLLHLLEGLKESDLHTRQMLSCVGRSARLEITWSEDRCPDIVLSMPGDRDLLVLAASRVLADVFRSVEGRFVAGMGDEYGSPRETTVRIVPDLASLIAVADDQMAADDLRASAILLSALHPGGGLEILSMRKNELVALAARGVAVTPGAALVIEALRGAERPETLELVSTLLDANPVVPFLHVLVLVLHRWRERSRAPVTTGGNLAVWLA